MVMDPYGQCEVHISAEMKSLFPPLFFFFQFAVLRL
jgi:hypothetical protein